jgi:hypothetical protein
MGFPTPPWNYFKKLRLSRFGIKKEYPQLPKDAIKIYHLFPNKYLFLGRIVFIYFNQENILTDWKQKQTGKSSSLLLI